MNVERVELEPRTICGVREVLPMSEMSEFFGRVFAETVEATHVGPHDTLAETYAQISAWMADQKLTRAEDMFEENLVGPDGESDPANWRARIAFSLA